MARENLPGNEPFMTTAEIEATKGFDEDGNEIAVVDPTPDAPAAAAVVPEVAAPAATPVEPAPATSAVVEPVAEPTPAAPAQPQIQGVAGVTINPGQPRDYKAEIAALKVQLEAGTLDDDQYEEQADAIKQARWEYESHAKIAAQLEQSNWNTNHNIFLQDPSNTLLAKSQSLATAWYDAMKRVADHQASIGNWPIPDITLMQMGRDLLYTEAGLTAAHPAATPTPATPAATQPAPRVPNLSGIPPTLGAAPGAAPTGARETIDTMAGKGIVDIERAMAGMTEAQLDEFMRRVPGGEQVYAE